MAAVGRKTAAHVYARVVQALALVVAVALPAPETSVYSRSKTVTAEVGAGYSCRGLLASQPWMNSEDCADLQARLLRHKATKVRSTDQPAKRSHGVGPGWLSRAMRYTRSSPRGRDSGRKAYHHTVVLRVVAEHYQASHCLKR